MRQVYLVISAIALGVGIAFMLLGWSLLFAGYSIVWPFILSLPAFWLAHESHPDRYEKRQIVAVFSRVKFEADPLELEQANNDPEFLVKLPCQQEDK